MAVKPPGDEAESGNTPCPIELSRQEALTIFLSRNLQLSGKCSA